MKETIIQYLSLSFCAIASFCFLLKLLLWFKMKPSERGNFFLSFIMFFSVSDVHDARTPQLKRFIKTNNILNTFFWITLFGFAILYVFATDDVNGLIPTKLEEYQNRK